MATEEGSCLIPDSNICIYRTLNQIEPEIFDDRLPKAVEVINSHTNLPTNGKIVLTPTIIREISQDKDTSYILSKEIQRFGVKVLGFKKFDFRLKKMERTALKSLNKFVAKYSYKRNFPSLCFDYNEMNNIQSFYLNYPQKLEEITKRKLSFLSDKVDRDKKQEKRPQNLPEKSDRMILCECLCINDAHSKPVILLSNDSDFTYFSSEINEKFDIEIKDFGSL